MWGCRVTPGDCGRVSRGIDARAVATRRARQRLVTTTGSRTGTTDVALDSAASPSVCHGRGGVFHTLLTGRQCPRYPPSPTLSGWEVSLSSVDQRVHPIERVVYRPEIGLRRDTPVSNRPDDCTGSRFVGVDDRVGATHLEREVCVAAADHRDVTLTGDVLHQRLVLGVFPVQLDGVEIRRRVADVAVSERVGHHCNAVAGVGEVDCLGRRERASGRLAGRVFTEDQDVSARSRYFDTGE